MESYMHRLLAVRGTLKEIKKMNPNVITQTLLHTICEQSDVNLDYDDLKDLLPD